MTETDERILVVTMRLLGSAPAGTLSNVASLTATGLNLGSGANLVSAATATGRMLDGRNTWSTAAQLIVEHSVAVGIFAAPPTGQLPSLGPLSGQTKTHQLVVSQVMSKPSQNDQSVTNDAALSCTTTEPSSVMVVSIACAVELGMAQTEGNAEILG